MHGGYIEVEHLHTISKTMIASSAYGKNRLHKSWLTNS